MQVNFKSLVVWLILNKQADRAIKLLAEKYKVKTPHLKVGLPKGHRTKTLGCYLTKNSTITLHNRELLSNPYVILHEFYHHLRTNIEKRHKGTEKNANKFALDFIRQYNKTHYKYTKIFLEKPEEKRKQK